MLLAPTYAQYVQEIAEKVYVDKLLDASERTAWESAVIALRDELDSENCNLFVSDEMKEWATCCRILAATEYFGFCTFLSVLGVSEKERNRLLKKKEREKRKSEQKAKKQKKKTVKSPARTPEGSFRPVSRWYDGYKYEEAWYAPSSQRGGVNIFLDLLEVACHPPIDNGLCSQFVSCFVASRVANSRTSSCSLTAFIRLPKCCSNANVDSLFCNSHLPCY